MQGLSLFNTLLMVAGTALSFVLAVYWGRKIRDMDKKGSQKQDGGKRKKQDKLTK